MKLPPTIDLPPWQSKECLFIWLLTGWRDPCQIALPSLAFHFRVGQQRDLLVSCTPSFGLRDWEMCTIYHLQLKVSQIPKQGWMCKRLHFVFLAPGFDWTWPHITHSVGRYGALLQWLWSNSVKGGGGYNDCTVKDIHKSLSSTAAIICMISFLSHANRHNDNHDTWYVTLHMIFAKMQLAMIDN